MASSPLSCDNAACHTGSMPFRGDTRHGTEVGHDHPDHQDHPGQDELDDQYHPGQDNHPNFLIKIIPDGHLLLEARP
eukprot:13175907-Heterocapsa_arctica.AAC.1